MLKNVIRIVFGSLLIGVVTTGCDKSPQNDSDTSTTDSSIRADSRNNAHQTNTTRNDSAKTSDSPKTGKSTRGKTIGPSWSASESVFNFGDVWVGTTLRHEFKFRSVGLEPIQVLKAKAYCSCSKAGKYEKVVPPGEEGMIPYVLTTKSKEGPVHETLKVTFNDPSKPEWTLEMKGYVRHVCAIEVIADSRVDPGNAAGLEAIRKRKGGFGDIAADDTLYRVLRLVNTSGYDPLELRMSPLPGGTFEATLTTKTPGQVFELTIVGTPPYRTGYNNTIIRFQTNVPESPLWTIPIYAKLPERIEVVPSKVVANNKRATIKIRSIRITNHGATDLRVTAISASNPDFKLTLLPPDPRTPKLIKIELILPDGDYTPPPYGEFIRIETTDAEKPIIEIPVLPNMNPTPAPRPVDKPLKFYPGKMLG